MSDINAVVVVSFTKHWDNDAKGTYEVAADTIEEAIRETKLHLIDDALEDGVRGDQVSQSLFTITKAVWGVPTNWIGV